MTHESTEGELLPTEPLRLRRVGRAGVSDTTSHIVLALVDEDGREHWVQFPRAAAGLFVAAILESAKQAAEKAGESAPELPQFQQAMLSEGMRLTNYQIGVIPEDGGVLLSFETAAGLKFEFPVHAQDAAKLRDGLQKAESLLNRGKRRSRRH